MQNLKLTNASPATKMPLLNIVRLVVWLSAIICLAIILKVGYNKKTFLKAFKNTDAFLQDNNNVDSVFLNAGDLNFSDKTSFVVDAFRFQGNYEQLPEKIDIDKDRKKLYNYIFQRKIRGKNNIVKPEKAADFSIKSLSNP